MITVETLLAIDKNDLQEAARTVEKEDLPQLVDWLMKRRTKSDTRRFFYSSTDLSSVTMYTHIGIHSI
jgi:hypothetical protein